MMNRTDMLHTSLLAGSVPVWFELAKGAPEDESRQRTAGRWTGKHQYMMLTAMMLVAARVAVAVNSAPSSHMVFNDGFDGDIVINEVRVPEGGEARYTYYECLGWRGAAAGYTGIQSHPRGRLFIFSIWDNKQQTAPIQAAFTGPGTEAIPFGGEGTGLKSWNFQLGWSTGTWYTFIARSWPAGDHTLCGLWVRAGDTGTWTHLVTMDVSTPDGWFRGRTDAFIEDWSRSGIHRREIHLRNGWKRKIDGTWFPFTGCKYSVNQGDLGPGKRSFNFRESWNGGTREDETGPYYFMVSGGKDTRPEVENPSHHAIERDEKAPDYGTIRITESSAEVRDNALLVKWKTDSRTLPQFAYKIQVFADRAGAGKALMSLSEQEPDRQAMTLDASSLDLARKTYTVHLQCIDILDGASKTAVMNIGRGSRP